jgi:hypothetical protein
LAAYWCQSKYTTVEIIDSEQLKVNGMVSLTQKSLPLPVVFFTVSVNQYLTKKKTGVFTG